MELLEGPPVGGAVFKGRITECYFNMSAVGQLTCPGRRAARENLYVPRAFWLPAG